jgi:GAF domain-containing protein
MLLDHGSRLGRLAASKSPVHIPDTTAHEVYSAGEADGALYAPPPVAVVKAGVRTGLFVPMLRNDELIGVLTLGRWRIESFAKNEIELVTDFAAHAAIALEITRRERQLRELQMELAHANRVVTMGQLSASITHEVNQPIAAARTNVSAAVLFLRRQRAFASGYRVTLPVPQGA